VTDEAEASAEQSEKSDAHDSDECRQTGSSVLDTGYDYTHPDSASNF
jgi:hypothetical protein